MCSGEPSRKAGNPKLHPSKPGGTFVGSKARQVEVEMKRRSVPHSSQGRVLVSTPSPGGALTPDPIHFSLDRHHLLTLNGTLQLAQDCQLGHYTQGALSLANVSLQAGPAPVTFWAPDYLPAPWPDTSCRDPPTTTTTASGDNSTVRWPEKGVDKGKRQFFNPYY